MNLFSVELIYDICGLVSCVSCILIDFFFAFIIIPHCNAFESFYFQFFYGFFCMATEQLRFLKKYLWSFSILTNILDFK